VKHIVGQNKAVMKMMLALVWLPIVLVPAAGNVIEVGAAVKWQKDKTCGKDLFCGCNPHMQHMSPDLCKTTLKQCHRSFCSPLCLRMAWMPHVNVDCSNAHKWVGCQRFAEEMVTAERAITAQFQAYVCSTEFGCCNNVTRLVDWVEGHVFGDQYPRSLLPTQSCKAAAARSAHSAAETCKQCQAAVTVHLDLDTKRCLPPHGTLRDVAPLSLHERCLFLADRIGTEQSRLKEVLRKQVCSCAGCCAGDCFFREREHDWLASIIADVTTHFETNSPFGRY